jgi:NitT/TauT family transport system substrate-binding protein
MSVRRWKMVCWIAFAGILSGCSALGGPDPVPDRPGAGGLEKTSLQVAIQPSVDAAPYWLAQAGGYFRAEGLDVKTVLAENPAASRDKALSGDADLAELTYPTFFLAVKGGAELRLVADGTAAKPKSNVLITVPTSPVKSINDLPGKRIAITSKNSTTQLLTQAVMKDHGLDYSKVTWVQLPLPNMAAALPRDVDAAYQPEPYASAAARTVGATAFIDVAAPGTSTEDFPVLGYVAKKQWTEANPKTMAAFQRAMLRASRDAEADRSKWESLVIENTKANETDVKLMTPPRFTSIADPRRLQRVPKLMTDLGVIPTEVDAASVIVKQATP